MRDVQNVDGNPPFWYVMPFLKGPIASKASSLFGLASQGKGYVMFRFIIEYSSLRDFGP